MSECGEAATEPGFGPDARPSTGDPDGPTARPRFVLLPGSAGTLPHDIAHLVAGGPPAGTDGGATSDLQAQIGSVCSGELDDAGLIDRITDTEHLLAWAHAEQASAMAELLRRRARADTRAAGGDGSGYEVSFAVDEVALALTIPRVTAGQRTDLATTLVERLPATLTALHAGRIDLTRARVIAEATTRLSPDHAALVEQSVLPDAARMTAGRLRPRVARAAATIEPDTIEDDHAEAAEKRRVTRTALEDGMAGIWAILPADGAAAVWTMINSLAEAAHSPGDTRTADQRRADVLTDLAHGHVTGRLAFTLHPTGHPHAGTAAGATTTPTASTAGTAGSVGTAGSATPGTATPGTATPRAATPGTARTEPGAGTGTGTGTAAGTGTGTGPGATGRLPRWAQVQILIPADLLEGRPSAPAELAGHGPIPTSMALRLAADADWRRLVYDPDTGRALALSSRAHDPPKALRELSFPSIRGGFLMPLPVG